MALLLLAVTHQYCVGWETFYRIRAYRFLAERKRRLNKGSFLFCCILRHLLF